MGFLIVSLLPMVVSAFLLVSFRVSRHTGIHVIRFSAIVFELFTIFYLLMELNT